MRLASVISMVFVLSMPTCLQAALPELSPAQKAYREVSVYRDKHSDVIWDNKAADRAALLAIRADLQAGVALTNNPLNKDLGEGSVYLRFRRYNYLMDLIKINARLGDKDAAFQSWDELVGMSWSPIANSLLLKDPHVAQLQDDPRYKRIKNTEQLAQRLARAPALAQKSDKALSTEEKIAGLSRIWSVARDGFVWFDNVPELDWDKAYLDYLPKVMAAESNEQYYKVLIRFMAQLRDGHSNVYVPDSMSNKLYSRPGIRTARVEGKVVVTSLRDMSLLKHGMSIGDEILTVDGMPVEEYAKEKIVPYESSSTSQDLEVRSFTYALLAGDAAKPVKLDLIRANGSKYSIELPRSGYKAQKAAPVKSFILRNDGVAVLTADQFENDDAFKALEANLDVLKKAKALIIDLRGNGGGSSNFGTDILTYLSASSIPTTVSTYRENTAYGAARSGEDASIEWRRVSFSSYNPGRKYIFEKPVAMLIDAQTFSAAEDTAADFKLMKRGLIIGMPSGGSTGQPMVFSLPGGGTARICVKRDTYPDGSNFVGVGVIPDIRAAITLDDVRQAKDSVMERAVKELLKK